MYLGVRATEPNQVGGWKGSMPRWSPWLAAVLLVGLAASLYAANARISQLIPGGEEFLPCWAGARTYLAEGESPYGPDAARLGQETVYGRPAETDQGESRLVCPYPTSLVLPLLVTGLFPFEEAWPVYITLLELGLLALAALSLRWIQWRLSPARWLLTLGFALVWYYGVHAILRGDPAVLVGVLMMASLLSFHARQDAAAAIFLAFSTAVPGLGLPMTVWILLSAIARRRWNLLGWYVLVVGLLVGAFYVIGDTGPLPWIRNAVESARSTGPVSAISIISRWIPSFSRPLEYLLSALLIVLQILLWARSLRSMDRPAAWTAAHTLVVTALIFPSSGLAYQVILLPPLFLVLALVEERWGKWGAVISAAVAIGILVVPWWNAMSDPLGEAESVVWRLILPLLCLVGLWWNKWWVERSPRSLRGYGLPCSVGAR